MLAKQKNAACTKTLSQSFQLIFRTSQDFAQVQKLSQAFSPISTKISSLEIRLLVNAQRD
jgi:spore coat polysaccharide biosynthesis protein SpsF (cytidylyltransferase family)